MFKKKEEIGQKPENKPEQKEESKERYVIDVIATQTTPILVDTKTLIDGKPRAYYDIIEILAEILNRQESIESLLQEAMKD